MGALTPVEVRSVTFDLYPILEGAMGVELIGTVGGPGARPVQGYPGRQVDPGVYLLREDVVRLLEGLAEQLEDQDGEDDPEREFAAKRFRRMAEFVGKIRS